MMLNESAHETDNDGMLAVELPPTTFENGITVKIYDKSGALIITKTPSERREVNRATIYNVALSNQ